MPEAQKKLPVRRPLAKEMDEIVARHDVSWARDTDGVAEADMGLGGGGVQHGDTLTQAVSFQPFLPEALQHFPPATVLLGLGQSPRMCLAVTTPPPPDVP